MATLNSLCISMDQEEINFLETLTKNHHFKKGDIICREGDEAKQIFFIISGKVKISLEVEDDKYIRLGGFSAGSAFGESALIDASFRSADAIASTEVEVKELYIDELRNREHPLASKVENKLYKNLASQYDVKLRNANKHIRALSAEFRP
ncbi:MAG: cyclic nucleotide-binding domain-containing protein [Gammaproteobacteria bacterium]|nr:cyclic nucleotide-binding domain-containing protein [Gammaproteobacteria bacterium]